MSSKVLVAALGVAAACACIVADAAPRKHVTVDGNRTRATHLIPLYDEMGNEIRPDDNPGMPFSPKMTCGDCHDYDKIGAGWHFNSSSGTVEPGRKGEPWVMADESAGVQLPLSYRDWQGTWKPQDLGMSEWDFVKMFGRHIPGGDAGEKENPMLDEDARWDVSGKLEINCLACHNADPAQNNSEWAIQIGRENFRWAATSASGIGVVTNLASRLPEYYDIFVDGPNIDSTWAAVPEVLYDAHRFNRRNYMFMNVTREGTANRCYSCHSSVPRDLANENINFWDQDVHITAGMSCTSCHRNGLDHDILRGYEGERKETVANTLTCRGCHLGNGENDGAYTMGGRLGAPRPLHRGLPAVHLEKISCTGCHSGPLVGDEAVHIRTARGNRLGIHGRAQWDMEVPYIQAPVYLSGHDGKIAPHYMMYPAFWGVMEGGNVTPLVLDAVKPIVEAVRLACEEAEAQAEKPAEEAVEEGADATAESTSVETEEVRQETVEELKPLTEQQVIAVLQELAKEPGFAGTAVYVGGGKLYQLDTGGNGLTASDNKVCEPYSWPMSHDVRPATQSLGAGGCGDCHSDGSGFFYAKVAGKSPIPLGGPVVTAQMFQLEGLDHGLLKALKVVAGFRVPIVIAGVLLAILLAAAVIHFGLFGLEGLFRTMVSPGSVDK